MTVTIEQLKRELTGKAHWAAREMTNFGRAINLGLADELRADPFAVARYTAWNFFGSVCYREGEFHCVIQVDHEITGLISAPTLEELMKKCCAEYGDD